MSGPLLYGLLKVAHITAVMAWMAGLLRQSMLLSRQGGVAGPRMPEIRRLLIALQSWDRRVTVPAMLLAWACGMALALRGYWFGSGWLTLKLAPVLLLSALHGIQAGTLRRMIGDHAAVAPRYLQYGSAMILVALFMIIALVVLKPF